ncbi:MAG: class I SAM-dependent methyltransferase [Candidatus Competibacteraceae bacterium]
MEENSVRLPVDIAENYNRYFASHLYDKRYPHPNLLGLSIIIREIRTQGRRILDFGCGNGRYTAPLLECTNATITAYDISRVAITELSSRCVRHIVTGRLHPVLGDLIVLTNAAVASGEQFDLAIMMFGVLGHIPSQALRRQTLTTIRNLLRPGGRLVVTVPNIGRRFPQQQLVAQRLVQQGYLEPGDILYQRTADHITVEMYYHLYTLKEFVSELDAVGFRLVDLRAESFLPESCVVKSVLLRWLDRASAAVSPLRYAYGFLAVAEVAAAPDQAARAPYPTDDR